MVFVRSILWIRKNSITDFSAFVLVSVIYAFFLSYMLSPERSVKRMLSVLQTGLRSWWQHCLRAQSYLVWAECVRQQWAWNTSFGLPRCAFPLLIDGHGDRDGDTEKPVVCCLSWGVARRWGRELRRKNWVSCGCQIDFRPQRAWHHRQGYYTFATSIFTCKLNTSDTRVPHGIAAEVNSRVFVSKGGPPAVQSLPQCHYRCIY